VFKVQIRDLAILAGPAPAYQERWCKHFGVTHKQAATHLRLEGVMEAGTNEEAKERVWRAACRRARKAQRKFQRDFPLVRKSDALVMQEAVTS